MALRSKRGQMFTLVSIIILSLLFVSFEIYSFISEGQSVKTRVDTMNVFLHSVEGNLERQLYVAGYRIIFLAETRITQNGSYIDVDDFFEEAFFNGTVNGTLEETYLSDVTYDDLIEDINDLAEKMNVEVNMSNSVLIVSQDDPWYVRLELVSDFTMLDMANLSNWSKVQTIVAYVPISGFEDPFYTINSNAKVSHKIYPTIYEGMYANGADVTNFSKHVASGYYAANSNAPSFLNRLEGDFSSDSNGIESFVDVTAFSNQSLSVKDKTRIDYLYFSSTSTTDYTVPGMQPWFIIDDSDDHLTKYNVSSTAVPK